MLSIFDMAMKDNEKYWVYKIIEISRSTAQDHQLLDKDLVDFTTAFQAFLSGKCIYSIDKDDAIKVYIKGETNLIDINEIDQWDWFILDEKQAHHELI